MHTVYCLPFVDDESYYLVTELCEGGDLLDELDRRETGTLAEQDVAIVINALLSCVNYFHQRNIVHRDLKLENILLHDHDYNDVKVIDLGLAKPLKKGENLDEVVGTPYYIAPEMLRHKYDHKCDIWSVGVIAFMLLGGYAPFDGDNDKEILASAKKGEFVCDDEAWDLVSDEALEFLLLLLEKNPKKRPTAAEALEHPWLASQREIALRQSGTRRRSLRNSLAELKKFQSKRCLLKQATSAMMASQHQHNDEVKLIGRAFQSVDQTCSGKLSKEDFAAVMDIVFSTGDTDTSLEDEDVCDICIDSLFEQVNVSRSGSIEYSEFVGACLLQKNTVDEAHVKQVFKSFDKADKGYISRQDLNEILSVKDDSTLDKIIAEADISGNGFICYEDFRAQMMGQAVPFSDTAGNDSGKNKGGGFKKFGEQILWGRNPQKTNAVVTGSRYSRQHWISAPGA